MRGKKYFAWVILLLVVVGVTGCATTPQSGEIGVVRNGRAWYNPFDWFDNHNIRQVVPNGSNATWTGMGSSTHFYPVDTQQRFYKAEACFEDAQAQNCSADRGPFHIQTKDGVDLGIEGTAYLNTTFNDSPNGEAAVRSFDNQYATRTFNGDHAYDGVSGWTHFLGAIVDPVASNNLRDIGSGLECAEFVSSCSLVQNQGQNGKPLPVANKNNKSNIQNVQDAVSKGLTDDLRNTIGGTDRNHKKIAYFGGIKFIITHVDLPAKIQASIDDAQASFTQVSKVNAQVQQEKAQVKVQHQRRLANQERQRGYAVCHSCQRQDELSKLSHVQTLVFGGNSPIAIGGK